MIHKTFVETERGPIVRVTFNEQCLQDGSRIQSKRGSLRRAKANTEQRRTARFDRQMLPRICQGLCCLLQPNF